MPDVFRLCLKMRKQTCKESIIFKYVYIKNSHTCSFLQRDLFNFNYTHSAFFKVKLAFHL